MSHIFSVVAFIATMLLTLTRRISPTERARVVIRHAHLAGSGLPVTRADVIADLATLDGRGFPDGKPAVTPDPEPPLPDPAPDDIVTLDVAAARLSVSVATIRRYCAPSSGRLIRAGSGVTRASLEAVAATR
ncbi:hypothetical protein [Frankia sp. EAN1pec]|uniref:hypothetical protein n=1 Tax=Parafrankia sp. (strain EAN1pec) TaxID=298653 RepID=UPI0002FD7399